MKGEKYIRLKTAEKAMRQLEKEDIEAYACHIPECFPADRAIEALRKIPMTTVQEARRAYSATIIVDVVLSDEEADEIEGGDMRSLFDDLRMELNSCWHGVKLKKVTIEELNCSMEGLENKGDEERKSRNTNASVATQSLTNPAREKITLNTGERGAWKNTRAARTAVEIFTRSRTKKKARTRNDA